MTVEVGVEANMLDSKLVRSPCGFGVAVRKVVGENRFDFIDAGFVVGSLPGCDYLARLLMLYSIICGTISQ